GGIPAVHGAIADGDGGDAGHPQTLELFDGGRLGLDVDGIELDPPRREELLRLGAGRSARAVVEAWLHGILRVQDTRARGSASPERRRPLLGEGRDAGTEVLGV